MKPDLLVFPELTLSGYPPEDLLFHGGFRQAIDRALATVRDAVRGMGVIVGYPEYVGRDIYNSAALLCDGALVANHRKRELPNYKVFDEKRYFRAGHRRHGLRASRLSHWPAGVRGHLGVRCGAPGARCGRRAADHHQCLAF